MRTLADVRDAGMEFISALDYIEQHEANEDAIAATIMVTLRGVGYDKVDAFTAALQIACSIQAEFDKRFYRAESLGIKAAIYMAACMSAESIITGGRLSGDIKKAVQEQMATGEISP
jgi:hypothetical protein